MSNNRTKVVFRIIVVILGLILLLGILKFLLENMLLTILLAGGIIFIASMIQKNKAVRCASCGWIGSKIRYTQRNGCPFCGSDLYYQ